MLTSQSQLKISKESRDYLLICPPDSPVQEVQAVLHEMLDFCASVIKSAEEKADKAAEEQVVETVIPEVIV